VLPDELNDGRLRHNGDHFTVLEDRDTVGTLCEMLDNVKERVINLDRQEAVANGEVFCGDSSGGLGEHLGGHVKDGLEILLRRCEEVAALFFLLLLGHLLIVLEHYKLYQVAGIEETNVFAGSRVVYGGREHVVLDDALCEVDVVIRVSVWAKTINTQEEEEREREGEREKCLAVILQNTANGMSVRPEPPVRIRSPVLLVETGQILGERERESGSWRDKLVLLPTSLPLSFARPRVQDDTGEWNSDKHTKCLPCVSSDRLDHGICI